MTTYPDHSFAGPFPAEEALFAAAAAGYAHYRPGLPDEAVRLLADTLRGRPAPTLLDLGTSTRQVPFALLAVVSGLAHIAAVVVNRPMLDQARAGLTLVLGRCTLALVHSTADTYAPLAPLTGEAVRAPDLVTCCRSYHWMSGPDVLAMADRVAAPDATIAIMGDGSLWAHQSDWTWALRELIQSYLGPGRRAGARGDYAKTRRTFKEDLAGSAWRDVTHHRIPVARTWTPENVVGYLRTTSFAGADLFKERHCAFEADAWWLLDAHAGEGLLVEDAVFTVLLARRPGGAS